MARQAKKAGLSYADNRNRLESLGAVAARFEAWRPAVQVMTEVRSVQTIFPQVDAVTRVGGWPIERFGLLHGPSNEGKTEFLIGLGLSFLQRGHFYAHVDAEFTTPARWLSTLMREHARHPGFVALRPTTYEATRDAVREFCEGIGNARSKGELDPDTTALIGLDSIRKLVPKRLWDTLAKEGAGEERKGPGGRKQKPAGVDGMGGRAAQYKAALNAQWLDELIPLLAQTGTAMVVISRETDDADANMFSGKDFKVGGGKALYYDSSLVVRVQRASYVRDGQGAEALLYGERRSIEIHKTKVGGKEERLPEVYYHTSNGALDGVPEGFDRPRDVLEMAVDHGIVKLAGAHHKWGQRTLGNGVHAAVRRLHQEPELATELEAEVRSIVAQRET